MPDKTYMTETSLYRYVHCDFLLSIKLYVLCFNRMQYREAFRFHCHKQVSLHPLFSRVCCMFSLFCNLDGTVRLIRTCNVGTKGWIYSQGFTGTPGRWHNGFVWMQKASCHACILGRQTVGRACVVCRGDNALIDATNFDGNSFSPPLVCRVAIYCTCTNSLANKPDRGIRTKPVIMNLTFRQVRYDCKLICHSPVWYDTTPRQETENHLTLWVTVKWKWVLILYRSISFGPDTLPLLATERIRRMKTLYLHLYLK
jgi:hypothetical protein